MKRIVLAEVPFDHVCPRFIVSDEDRVYAPLDTVRRLRPERLLQEFARALDDRTGRFVRYSPSLGVHILAYAEFPFVYVYDARREIDVVFRLEPFEIGTQGYWPATGMIAGTEHDHNAITNVSLVDDSFLVIEVVTRRQPQLAEERYVWERELAYLGFDLVTRKSYYLGSKEAGDDPAEPRLFFGPDGLLLNARGTLTSLVSPDSQR